MHEAEGETLLQSITKQTATTPPAAVVRPGYDLDASLDPFDSHLGAHPSVYQLPVSQQRPRSAGRRTTRRTMVAAGLLSFGVGFVFTLVSMVLLLP